MNNRRKCDCWLANETCYCDMDKKEIKFKEVDSSQVKAIGYDADSETLYIKFRNKQMYSYSPVSQEEFDEFDNAESAGSHFHRNIKMRPKYNCVKIEE